MGHILNEHLPASVTRITTLPNIQQNGGSGVRIRPAIVHPREENAMRPHGESKMRNAKVLQKQDTGWTLTVAHAVWYFAGATLGPHHSAATRTILRM